MTLGRAILIAVLFLAVTSATAYGAAAKQPTTAGSFLKFRVNSPAELAAMVRQDPTLAARYSRHFGTTSDAVVDFFQNQVQLVRLRQSKTAMVYFIGASGSVASNKRVFPAGTLVFATRQGEPVLDWRCGNPLMSSLPISQARAAAKDAAAAAPAAAAAQPEAQVAALPEPQAIVEQVLDQPPMEFVATMLQPAALTPPTAPLMIAALPPVVEAAAIPIVSAVETVPAIVQGSRGLGWLLPLAAIGGVAGGSGGRGRELPPPASNPVVPEPSALMILASGVAASGVGASAVRRRMRGR